MHSLLVVFHFCIAYHLTYAFIAYILVVVNQYLKDDNNRQVKDIAESLKSIATSLKFFERIVLNDSNYVSKNKKDIDVNINKINEVIKDIKEKIWILYYL